MTTTYTVRIVNDRHFAKSVQEAKRLGGRYDGVSKTWTIDASKVYNLQTGQPYEPGDLRRALRGRGLELIGNVCPHYTRDQGCPLHGETCAPEYTR